VLHTCVICKLPAYLALTQTTKDSASHLPVCAAAAAAAAAAQHPPPTRSHRTHLLSDVERPQQSRDCPMPILILDADARSRGEGLRTCGALHTGFHANLIFEEASAFS
jgi:hypothetical protein